MLTNPIDDPQYPKSFRWNDTEYLLISESRWIRRYRATDKPHGDSIMAISRFLDGSVETHDLGSLLTKLLPDEVNELRLALKTVEDSKIPIELLEFSKEKLED